MNPSLKRKKLPMGAPSTSGQLDELKVSSLIKYLKLETKETYPTQETKVNKDQELLTSWNKRNMNKSPLRLMTCL